MKNRINVLGYQIEKRKNEIKKLKIEISRLREKQKKESKEKFRERLLCIWDI